MGIAEPAHELRPRESAHDRNGDEPDEGKKGPHHGEGTSQRDVAAEWMQEGKVTDTVGTPRGDGGRHGGAQVVPDHAAPRDPQCVEQFNDSFRVTFDRQVSALADIRSAETQQVRDNDSVTGRQQRNEVFPQVATRWKAVQENDRIAFSAGTSSVVVEPAIADFYELTSHSGTPPSAGTKRGRFLGHPVVAK